jgi:hypothetical protein
MQKNGASCSRAARNAARACRRTYASAHRRDAPHAASGPVDVNYVTLALGEAAAGKALSKPVTQPYGCSVKYGSAG